MMFLGGEVMEMVNFDTWAFSGPLFRGVSISLYWAILEK
jgi:hypothetical protein